MFHVTVYLKDNRVRAFRSYDNVVQVSRQDHYVVLYLSNKDQVTFPWTSVDRIHETAVTNE